MLKMVVEVGGVKLKSLSESLDSEDTTNPFQKKSTNYKPSTLVKAKWYF